MVCIVFAFQVSTYFELLAETDSTLATSADQDRFEHVPSIPLLSIEQQGSEMDGHILMSIV
jgi:hypothetical protein